MIYKTISKNRLCSLVEYDKNLLQFIQEESSMLTRLTSRIGFQPNNITVIGVLFLGIVQGRL
jgi:hypothetical protein